MNLLVVCANLPQPIGGANARNYHLLKALASQHTISLLALVNTDEEAVLASSSSLKNLVQRLQVVIRPLPRSKRWEQLLTSLGMKSYLLQLFQYAELQETLDYMIADNHYDSVLFESMFVAGYQLPSHTRIIIDQHNIEYELLQRTYLHGHDLIRKWYNWQECRQVRQAEIERCSRADMALVTSGRDREALKGLLQSNPNAPAIEVVPNGVDIDFFVNEEAIQEVEHRIVFTGTMDYYPNSNAVVYFARHCWPLIQAKIPDATWQIVGRNPPREVRQLGNLKGVTVTGTVPDIRPHLSAAAVAIVPLQIGSGTRLKILEAFAMRRAAVSTSIGCEGLAVANGTHLLVEDDPEAFAQGVVMLLQNPEMRNSLGNAGRSLVETEYSWQQVGTRLLHILEEKEEALI